ncbi:hypothetical protein QE401_004048 [Pseudoroseomonas cervicalis]|nr:hypothetical protein [Pseudoroseomonas cervicalis]
MAEGGPGAAQRAQAAPVAPRLHPVAPGAAVPQHRQDAQHQHRQHHHQPQRGRRRRRGIGVQHRRQQHHGGADQQRREAKPEGPGARPLLAQRQRAQPGAARHEQGADQHPAALHRQEGVQQQGLVHRDQPGGAVGEREEIAAGPGQQQRRQPHQEGQRHEQHPPGRAVRSGAAVQRAQQRPRQEPQQRVAAQHHRGQQADGEGAGPEGLIRRHGAAGQLPQPAPQRRQMAGRGRRLLGHRLAVLGQLPGEGGLGLRRQGGGGGAGGAQPGDQRGAAGIILQQPHQIVDRGDGGRVGGGGRAALRMGGGAAEPEADQQDREEAQPGKGWGAVDLHRPCPWPPGPGKSSHKDMTEPGAGRRLSACLRGRQDGAGERPGRPCAALGQAPGFGLSRAGRPAAGRTSAHACCARHGTPARPVWRRRRRPSHGRSRPGT